MKHAFAKMPTRYWFTILLALLTAFVFGQLNYGKLLPNAVPWGVLVLLVTALLGTGKSDALRLGALFGFLVSYAYLWFDNRNIHSLTQVLILIPLIVLPSLFGLLCGIAFGYLGWRLRRLFMRETQ